MRLRAVAPVAVALVAVGLLSGCGPRSGTGATPTSAQPGTTTGGAVNGVDEVDASDGVDEVDEATLARIEDALRAAEQLATRLDEELANDP